MEKKIVHLSDTSHPFTHIIADTDVDTVSREMTELLFSVKVDESGNADNSARLVSTPEFDAIRTFQSNWGYAKNWTMTDDLYDMVRDVTTVPNTLIYRFMDKWDMNRDEHRAAIRTELANLFVLRTEDNPRILHFSEEERKALESLEGEKSDMYDENVHNWDKVREIPLTLTEYNKAGKSPSDLRAELFREEADKRVSRYFIGQTGWAWFVHFIVDMPEEFDGKYPNSLYHAKDGRTTLHMTNLFMTEGQAWDYINEDIRSNSRFDDEFLSHVVELDKM